MTAVVTTTAMPAPVRATPRVTEWLVVLGAGVLLVLVSTRFSAIYWSPRAALLLIALGPGLVALLFAARSGDRAAIAGLAFVVVSGVSVIGSPAPKLSITGLYNNGGGWLLICSVVTAWALGRRLSAVAGRRLGDVILVAAAANAVMAWFQMSRLFAHALFRPLDGRAAGWLGNPVHLTALLVGASALLGLRWAESRRRTGDGASPPWGPSDSLTVGLLFLFGSAVQLSGGRTGIGLLVGVLIFVGFRAGIRATVPFVLAIVLGLVMANVMLPSDGTGATERVNSVSGSLISQRTARWAMATDAVRDSPLLGIGPGLYRRATSPNNTAAAAAAFGPDQLNREAHNIFVEYTTTTGILGLLALIAWLVLASRRARGPLAAFALVGGLSLLFQPLWVGLTPVLALALGAADGQMPVPFRRVGMALGAVLTTAGIVAAAWLLHGDAQLADAYRTGDPTVTAAAADSLAVWPEPMLASAWAWAHPGPGSGRKPDWRRSLAADRAAVRRDPSDTLSRIALAGAELKHGSRSVARAEYLEALRWDPFSVKSLLGLAVMDQQDGHTRRATRRCEAARAVVPGLRCRVYLANPE